MVDLTQRLRKVPWALRYRFGAKLASDIRRSLALATHRHCRVVIEGPAFIGPGFHLRIPDAGELTIGPGADLRRGFVCEISGGGRVTIGSAVTFTSNALIQCTTSINIGVRSTFGQSVMIADGNHRFRDHTTHILDQGYDFRPINIGNDVTVTAKCTVLSDIGDHALIGAHALVTKPIPPYCLALGSPARVVEYFGPPERRSEFLDGVDLDG